MHEKWPITLGILLTQRADSWMPWNYRETLARIDAAPSAAQHSSDSHTRKLAIVPTFERRAGLPQTVLAARTATRVALRG